LCNNGASDGARLHAAKRATSSGRVSSRRQPGRIHKHPRLSRSALSPDEPSIACRGRRGRIPSSLHHRHALDKWCVERRRAVTEQLLIASDSFDPLRPHEHGDAFAGEFERTQRELARQDERRIGDDPFRPHERFVVQEIDRRLSIAAGRTAQRNPLGGKASWVYRCAGRQPLDRAWLMHWDRSACGARQDTRAIPWGHPFIARSRAMAAATSGLSIG
jgi:hypothetical protein